MIFAIILAAIVIWNVVVSWLNARMVGLTWDRSRREGGWAFLASICALVQSAVGFSMLVALAATAVAYACGYPRLASLVMDFWYLGIILPALGSGLVVTIDSIRTAMRERDLASGITATINTGIMVNNIWQSIGTVANALTDIASTNDDGEDEAPLLIFAGIIACVAIASGALLTWVIMEHYRSVARATVGGRVYRNGRIVR